MGPLHCTKSPPPPNYFPPAKITNPKSPPLCFSPTGKMAEGFKDSKLTEEKELEEGEIENLGEEGSRENGGPDKNGMESKRVTEPFTCSTSGGEQSCLSLSSDGENGTSPRNQPVSSSGYGSENLPSQQDKQQKKKRLQQCLKELKQLITKQTTPSQDVAQKLGTIEALTQALEILRQKPQRSQSKSPVEPQPESVSKTLSRSSDSCDQDLSLLPAEAAIFTGDSGGSENTTSACNATVTLPDGLIVDVSENFTVFTGLSREELVEHKRFTDLVEPQDRPLLVLTSLRACSFRPTQMSLFARLRQGSANNIMPCHLHCVLSTNQDGSHSTKISISSLISAYSEMAKESLSNIRFCIRHSVSCKFTFVDASCVPFLGWLPQDLLGHSLLKYIHRDDISLIYEAYEAMVKTHGKPVRSKPYRLLLFNGEFALVETEWTIFQNPWSKKVDFVVGNSRVIGEPLKNKDVFTVSAQVGASLSRAATRLVGDELIMTEQKFTNLLSQPIQMALQSKKGKYSSKSSSKGSEPKLASPPQHKSPKPTTSTDPQNTTPSKIISNPSLQETHLLPGQFHQSASRKRKNESVSALAYVDNLVENMVMGGGARDIVLHSTNPHPPEATPAFPHGPHQAEGSPEGHSGGEELSGSPPESSGSGPFSYSQINCMENVQRLLQSQPRTHSSNESGVNNAGEKSGENSKSNSASPPHGEECHPAGRTGVPHAHAAAAAIIHRSHSAMQLEDHPPMPLTRELLKQHTKKWEKEYKESWKRRFSEEMSSVDEGASNPQTASAPTHHPSPLKRALETSAFINPDAAGFCPEKIFRSDVHRPASMPVLPRAGNNEIFASEWNQFLNSKAAEEYYRSLGPNPPPPPGRNVHISSAPLPPAPLPLNMEHPQAEARKSAFAPLSGRKHSEPPPWEYGHHGQPLNFSMHRENGRSPNFGMFPGQKSVIQQSPFFHNQSMVAAPGSGNSSRSSWLGSGSSASLHRSDFSDLQLARAKEASWMAGVPLTEDLVLRYRHPTPMDPGEVLAKDHQRLLQMSQPKLVNEQLEKVYSELESTQISKPVEETEGSAVKEATDALILLQES